MVAWRIVATVKRGNFEWDELKARENLRKHGITFEEAMTAFLDDLSISYEDSLHPERLVLIGLSINMRLPLVVHAERKGEELIRIISARRPTRAERREYEEGI